MARAAGRALLRGRSPTEVPSGPLSCSQWEKAGHKHLVAHSRWVWAAGDARRTLGHAVTACLHCRPPEVLW